MWSTSGEEGMLPLHLDAAHFRSTLPLAARVAVSVGKARVRDDVSHAAVYDHPVDPHSPSPAARRLTLLWSTILFAAREALRKACLGARVDGVGGNRSWAGVINLMWLSVPLGIVVAAALCYLWLFILQAVSAAPVPAVSGALGETQSATRQAHFAGTRSHCSPD